MKKIFKILILVIGLIPLLVNAEEKEVQYKWYKEVEENIRYENNAENICEYFDKNTFITTDWYYSTSKPKEEKFRTIEEVNMEVDISRYYSKYLEFKYFPMNGVKIYELEFFDKENNKIEYEIKQNIINNQNTNVLNDEKKEDFISLETRDILEIELKDITNIIDTKIQVYHEENSDFKDMHFFTYVLPGLMNNAFAEYEEEIKTECEDKFCITEIIIREEKCLTEPIKLNTVGYRYKDNLYKCFDKKKEYAPGYHRDLSNENYFKDENDYIIIEEVEYTCPTVEVPNCKNYATLEEISNSDLKKEEINNLPITEEITNIIEKPLKELKTPIAMVTKEKSSSTIPEYLIFITIFTIMSILLTIIIIAKKLKKCRLK